MSTKAAATPIGLLLSTGAPFIQVPILQRPYSWAGAETKELWQDLIAFHSSHPGIAIAGREYFLGSIVGQEVSKQHGEPAIAILDGQQRLATLTILLATIRDMLDKAGEHSQAQTVQMLNIAKLKGLNQPADYVLALNRIDEPFFANRVQAWPREPTKYVAMPPKTASHKLILGAQRFFQKQIADYAKNEGTPLPQLLDRLHGIVINNVHVVLITNPAWDAVADVFERLNDRGKGLSTLDLLRNLQISRAPQQQQQAVEGYWADVYELSDSATQVDSFLRHFWISHRGDVKSRSLYKEIKGVMDNPAEPKWLRDPHTFASYLQADTVLYKQIISATHKSDEATRHLRGISLLGANALMPAALATLASVSIKDQPRMLRALLSTFVRFNVIYSGESTELEERVYQAAKELRAKTSIDDVLPVLRPLLQSDGVIEEAFLKLAPSRTGYQRHLLEELERYRVVRAKYKGKAPPDAQENAEIVPAGSDTLWIEHIYPQSPDKTWGKWQGHDELVNSVGNLTLLHKQLNAAAQNDVFQKKLQHYTASQLRLNDDVKDKTAWSIQDIKQRQAALAKDALRIWAIF